MIVLETLLECIGPVDELQEKPEKQVAVFETNALKFSFPSSPGSRINVADHFSQESRFTPFTYTSFAFEVNCKVETRVNHVSSQCQAERHCPDFSSLLA